MGGSRCRWAASTVGAQGAHRGAKDDVSKCRVDVLRCEKVLPRRLDTELSSETMTSRAANAVLELHRGSSLFSQTLK